MIFEHYSKNKKILIPIAAGLLAIGIFLILEKQHVEEKNWAQISAELKECLPKSDVASNKKCLELMALIESYEDCVAAGFPIMKSNPSQCATPDGRTFHEGGITDVTNEVNNFQIGCDQFATTTDCSKIIAASEPKRVYSRADFYTEVASTSQSNRIDEHLFVDNKLVEIDFCGNSFKTRQITIDGADVVMRLAELASTSPTICLSAPDPKKSGVIETADVKTFKGNDVSLPGIMYIIYLNNGYRFDFNPDNGNIYEVSGYDGGQKFLGKLWKTFANKELGISLDYPNNNYTFNAGDWRVGSGSKGKAIQIDIHLPSGAVIYAYAATGDYTIEKGGFSVSPEGYVVIDDKYRILRRGSPAEVSFVPDEIWKLSDNSDALVLYGRNPDPHADYLQPPIRVLVNLHNEKFTGIGFALWNTPGGADIASPEDIAILKKIITSIKFI